MVNSHTIRLQSKGFAVRTRTVISFTLCAALAAGFFYRQSQPAAAKPQDARNRTTTVELVTVRIGDVPVELSAIGQIVSAHSVAIRPQVSGTLTRVLFTEGAAVKAGQALFEIDPAPYRAALQQAQAAIARDRASLLAAEAQEQRLLSLADRGYVTPQEVQDAKAAAAQARAGVQLSQAVAASARINLDRTLIRAPITGRAGLLTVKTGNLITANEATALVTINQLQPVQAEFTVPQSQLAALQQAMASGPVKIAVRAQTGGAALATGKLLFIDNSIDATTGTVKLKAEFDNREEKLWPGTFVSFTATLATESKRVLVPELAVQPGLDGSFVYLVGADSKAQLKTVKVARQIGSEVVIAEGLQGGERIVARAPRDLKPGAIVKIAETKPKAAAP